MVLFYKTYLTNIYIESCTCLAGNGLTYFLLFHKCTGWVIVYVSKHYKPNYHGRETDSKSHMSQTNCLNLDLEPLRHVDWVVSMARS